MDLTRQLGLIPPEKLEKTKILLIGAGGIGSMVGFSLAKMGFSHMQIWDKDMIEEHNIPNQFYMPSQVGVVKVEALRKNIYDFTGSMVEIVNDWWDGNLEYEPDIIVSAVDKMDIRYKIWEHLEFKVPEPVWLLDARMASRFASLYVVKFGDKESIEQYKKHGLYPSSEAVQEPCTARAIYHTVEACSYMVCNAAHDILTNKEVPYSIHGQLLFYDFSREKGSIKPA